MRAKSTILRVIAIGCALPVACLVAMTFALGATPQFFPHRRLPLGEVRGVVTGDGVAFVASADAGRVYKFDFDGDLLTWIDTRGRRIWIIQNGESISVWYRGQPSALDDPAFRVSDPHGAVASVEHNWLGHPFLVVRHAETATRASLQPWQLTVVQSPFPGLLWGPALIALLGVERWTSRGCQWRGKSDAPGPKGGQSAI